MNFMGMGIPEVGVILLVAFLVLGPGRSIDMARNAGKVLGDLRRSFNEVTSAVSLEAGERRPANQDRGNGSASEDSSLEPPPGVPMRAETPPDDGENPAENNPESGRKG